MTPDDQEFLRQSIESHNQLLAELTTKIMQTEEQLARTDRQIEKMSANCDLNFARLSQALLALTDHVESHERRVVSLERTGGTGKLG